VLLLIAAGAGYWWVSRERGTVSKIAEKPGIKSIAILPFTDLSPEKDQEWFCEGIAETIIHNLSQIKELRVIDRNSAFVYKDKYRNIGAIGDSLKVDAVLEGSVQKAGNRLRITAQLIKVSDESPLFSLKFDNLDIKEFFTIQDSISLAIAEVLKEKLLDKEKTAILKRYTIDVEAYNLYLKARNYMYAFDRQKALEFFQQAVEKDPHFALAYAQIADIYIYDGYVGFRKPEDAFPKAKDAAEKALQIDNTLSEAYVSKACVSLWYDWDWAGADSSFKYSIKLNPGYEYAHHAYSWYFRAMGRNEEALKEDLISAYYNPMGINPDLMLIYCSLGRYDDAMVFFKKFIEREPNNGYIYLCLARLYWAQAKYREAIDATLKCKSKWESWIWGDAWLAYSYGLAGEKDKAEQILQNMFEKAKKEYVPALCIAIVYIGLGNNHIAFQWLDKAYRERIPNLIFIKDWPEFNPIRTDPRYKLFLEKMGLPKD
jgi:TolB-like protein/Tfp pilus assembly protein PilF